MGYSDFTLSSVKKTFQLIEDSAYFTESAQPIPPSDWLQLTLKKGHKVGLLSEKARSETIVMPILLEIQELNFNKIGVYSGFSLKQNKEIGLSGECDFIISLGKQKYEIEAPIFCLIEAKDNDIELGIGQCVAQMIAARMFNESEGKKTQAIYGCSTTGVEWQFLKLEENRLIIDEKRYYLDRVENILGAIQCVIQQATLTIEN